MSSPAKTRSRSKPSASIMDSVKRQVAEATTVATEAVSSGAWMYPFYGIVYLFTHPSLLQPLLPTILNGILMSLGVVAVLFFFAYLPQVAVLAFVSGPLAFIAAIPLVLGEAYVAINFLAKSFLFDKASVDLFDAVLKQKGKTTLAARSKDVQVTGNKVRALGKVIGKPLAKLNLDNAVRYLLTLPLNFIPVVGTAFFLGYNGYKSGPSYHARYFQLKGMDKTQRDAAVRKKRGAYTGFGIAATVLGLVPVASVLFTFTSAVGAALLAADMESTT